MKVESQAYVPISHIAHTDGEYKRGEHRNLAEEGDRERRGKVNSWWEESFPIYFYFPVEYNMCRYYFLTSEEHYIGIWSIES